MLKGEEGKRITESAHHASQMLYIRNRKYKNSPGEFLKTSAMQEGERFLRPPPMV